MARVMLTEHGDKQNSLKPNSCSPAILKLLMEIEKEAVKPPPKQKTAPKDHIKENVKRLREIQEKSKQKITDNKPLKAVRPPSQYSNVQSKVSAMLKNTSFCNQQSDSSISPIQLSQKNMSRMNSPRSVTESIVTNNPITIESIATANNFPGLCDIRSPSTTQKIGNMEETLKLWQLGLQLEWTLSVSVISDALRLLIRDKDSEPHSGSSDDEKHFSSQEMKNDLPYNSPASSVRQKMVPKAHVPHQLGHIPAYLLERKKQWQEEEKRQRQQQIDASIPPGHTLLSDDERQETLLLLTKNQEELIQKLSCLPVRNDTVRLRHWKEELENQLAKVEEGIKIFSRPKVLIKNDS